MAGEDDNGQSLWIVVCLIGLGVLIWIVTQCSLRCSSRRKENWQRAGEYRPGGIRPVPGTAIPSYYNINSRGPFINATVPMDRDMEDYIIDQVGEPNSDCMLTPGGQCHLASGGLGTCGNTLKDARCYKTDSTLFNMSSRTTGLPLSYGLKKKA